MQFIKAERKKSKLRLALCGVSGSGKTTAALQIAKGLGGKTALIDSENRSASLYADQFDFDTLDLEAPYTPERYIEAIEAAELQGYDNIIIDSMSHEWMGTGGCLEINDEIARKLFKNNTFTAWSKTTPRHTKFLQKIVTSKAHIIATVRMKAEHIQDLQTKKVHRVGMKYEMRDNFEFEFTTVFNIDREGHFAVASKDRTNLFGDEPTHIDDKTGAMLDEWLNSGKNFYMSDENLVTLNELLNVLDGPTQDKVRAKYPNFAEERDTRFTEISNGLNVLKERMLAAKAEAERLEKEQIARELAEQAQQDAIDAGTGYEEDVMLAALDANGGDA